MICNVHHGYWNHRTMTRWNVHIPVYCVVKNNWVFTKLPTMQSWHIYQLISCCFLLEYGISVFQNQQHLECNKIEFWTSIKWSSLTYIFQFNTDLSALNFQDFSGIHQVYTRGDAKNANIIITKTLHKFGRIYVPPVRLSFCFSSELQFESENLAHQ